MTKVQNIKWISKEAQEAEVIITDGKYNICCFSQPFNGVIGDYLTEALHAYNLSEISQLEQHNTKIIKLSGTFNYLVEGKIIDKKLQLIKIGGITIDISDSYLPNDINEGDYISFECERIDLW